MDSGLLHPDEALNLVVRAGRSAHDPSAVERIDLRAALGRTISTPVFASVDQPPFDKSAMDGFAWSAHESVHGFVRNSPDSVFRVVDTIAAGEGRETPTGEGEVVRIMTGAPIPPGANAVQRVEWTENAGRAGDGVELVRFTARETISNVIRRGENQKAGELLLGPRILHPQDIGLLASSGYAYVDAALRPKVGIVSTGDELAAPGSPLGPFHIYDSNGPTLCAQAQDSGCDVRFYGAFPDDEPALTEALGKALGENDVVLVSGGVSMGEFDFVPKILADLGVRRVFHRVAMRPGKPTWFGTRGGKAVFGLPGNPVSTFVNFEFLVKAHLAARMGIERHVPTLRAKLAVPLARKGSDRVEFLPAVFENDETGLAVRPLRYHGSSMLSVLAEAQGLLRMEIGTGRIEAGGIVDVRLVRA
ncbi:MAG: gephyrin-like molybdotransferase Glp [Rectinema sp.]